MEKKHIEVTLKEDHRIIVISDIHGHLDRLIALLNKINYQKNDYLVILGDFVEKGDQVLETIHYIQKLNQNPHVFVLAGNCEWAILEMLTNPKLAHRIPHYLQRISSNGCIRTIIHRLHLDYRTTDPAYLQSQVADALQEELQFISQLPVTLKINNHIFVHAGLEKRRDFQNSSLSSLLEMQHFLDKGHICDETVVVGHLPTSNYYQNIINNDIIIDREKKIICIDGGTGVKKVSQLNALIIESQNNDTSYRCFHVQPLPIYRIKKDMISLQQDIHKISFPYYEVKILKKGLQFSQCLQIETNQIFMIKNEFLYQRDNKFYCLDDYTDCFLSIPKDEKVKVIGIYGPYAYVIYKHQTGWIDASTLIQEKQTQNL